MFFEEIVVFSDTNNSSFSVLISKENPLPSSHLINTYNVFPSKKLACSSEIGSSLYDIIKLLKFS